MKRHLFITGEPGVGKTTIVKMLTDNFNKDNRGILGFYTEEIRIPGKGRIGFDVVSAQTSERGILARVLPPGSRATGPKVSKFTVDLDSFERTALPFLSRKCDNIRLCVIDEIGKMELFSHRFKTQVMKLIESDNLVLLCTVPVYSIKFVDMLKSRDDVELFTVTRENRDNLKNILVESLAQKMKSVILTNP